LLAGVQRSVVLISSILPATGATTTQPLAAKMSVAG
jgi:hypothetical protein